MPVRAREELDIMEMLEAGRYVRPRREGPQQWLYSDQCTRLRYVRPAERLHTVEDDPNLRAIPSAYFARRTWILAQANAQIMHAEWQRTKLFYITMTDFAKMQSKLDREVDPEEVELGPWMEMMRENIQEQIAGNRMSMDTLFQFELLHARMRTNVEEGQALEVVETMIAMQALFQRHAKMWLDYNACIPRPYRLTMVQLWPGVVQECVMPSESDKLGPELGGFFREEVVPEIMAHVVIVYCEAEYSGSG